MALFRNFQKDSANIINCFTLLQCYNVQHIGDYRAIFVGFFPWIKIICYEVSGKSFLQISLCRVTNIERKSIQSTTHIFHPEIIKKRTMYICKAFYRKCLETRWIHQCVIRTYSLAKTESSDLTTIYFQEDYLSGVIQIVKAFSSWLWILSFNKRLHYTCTHTNFPVSSREQFW